jgi:L,D-peptidoglycan transpeptidase YkuD (ErfK/YbiS/YcfS/YnhG family)
MRVRAVALAVAVAVAASACGYGRSAAPVAPSRAGTGAPTAATPSVAPDPVAACCQASSPLRAAGRSPARQLVIVSAAAYGATYAAVTAYRAAGGRWLRVYGPWTARIGRGGMAVPGGKREGDGRTPSGTYPFSFFFGVEPNPGVTFGYRRSQPYDVWDDDPASPRYNQWVDDRHADPGAAPEPMHVSGYDYGAVIAYNTARTPGLGSAIFLHVNIGIATAGCVTLPPQELLSVLRWLRPALSPRIELGVDVTPPGG